MATWFYFALTILGWGMGLFLMKIASKYIDNWTAVVFNLPGYLLVGLLLVPKVKWSQFTWTTGHTVAIIVGACYVIANWGFYRAAETAQISVLTPMTALYMTIPILLGFVLLGERPTPIQCCGMVLAVVAMIMLAWPSQASAV
ncbi:MAG: EamA family transporter [Phycisphaerae bacterium]|nr:EamA family transporter [Phycisphaerae bacterium]